MEYHRSTSLVDMAVYEREDPMRLGGLAFRIFKRGREEMVVPGEARGEWPRPWIRLIARSSVALERRREIISVTKKKSNSISDGIGRRIRSEVTHTPKIKVLGHVDLLKDSHEALFLAWLFDLVTRRYGKHFRLVAVIHVVTTDERDRGSLRDEQHVPARGKSHETYGKH